MTNNQLQLVIAETDMTDVEIDNLIVALTPIAIRNKTGFGLLISGFDDDSRELGDIPEVVAFCKRLLARGFISVLRFAPALEEVSNPTALTAFHIWKIARGEMTGGQFTIDRSQLEVLKAVLVEANRTADAMIEIYDSQPPELREENHMYVLVRK